MSNSSQVSAAKNWFCSAQRFAPKGHNALIAVHTLGEVVQRVEAYLAFLKDRQLRRLDLRDRSGGAEVFGIHSQIVEPCRELCFRTRERHLLYTHYPLRGKRYGVL